MKHLFLTPAVESGLPGPPVAPRRLKFHFFLIPFIQILLIPVFPGLLVFGATSANQPRASATGISGANAELNGMRMTSGDTLFAGDVVTIGASSSVALRFGKSIVGAAPETEFVVETEGVRLRRGRLQVRGGSADSFVVFGPFFRVNVASSGGAPGSAEVRVGGTLAQVSALAGVADLTAEGRVAPYKLRAGETATLDAGGAQGASSPTAGQVSRLVPDVQIERASRKLIAAVSTPVFWNDDLNSGPTGRAHITLTDGSLLNLGSNSTLRILQHDAQAQQTSLDLVIGRMRGQVLKLTRPGAKFEIRTPVGAAGLVGTDFSLLVTDDFVELMVFEGVVRFTIFSNGQAIDVNAGMVLRISRTGVAEGPRTATLEEIALAKSLTDISETPVQQAAERKRRNLAPVVIWVSTGAVAAPIIYVLTSRPPVSQVAP
jgi:ferric-dicitrate binding protein FerR (iron transport regulator)